MNFTLNRHLLTAKEFDSGSLGALTSVVHQFTTPGAYQVAVLRHGVRVAVTDFEVKDDSTNFKLVFDLPQFVGPNGKKQEKCECKHPGQAAAVPPVVSSKGFVLFCATTAPGGYSASVVSLKDGKVAFTSDDLQKGDLFALSLFEPGSYAMTNSKGTAKGAIEVTFKKEDAKRLRLLETLYVEASKTEFKPAAVKLVSTQGLVFKILESARIVIKRTSESAFDSHKPSAVRFMSRQ